MEMSYKVGDLIVPDPSDEKVQRGIFSSYNPPFTVIRLHKPFIHFKDSKGRIGDTWLSKRFLPAEIPYDPTQAGDKDDDI